MHEITSTKSAFLKNRRWLYLNKEYSLGFFSSMWEINENHRPGDYKDIWNTVWCMDDRPYGISKK